METGSRDEGSMLPCFRCICVSRAVEIDSGVEDRHVIQAQNTQTRPER